MSLLHLCEVLAVLFNELFLVSDLGFLALHLFEELLALIGLLLLVLKLFPNLVKLVLELGSLGVHALPLHVHQQSQALRVVLVALRQHDLLELVGERLLLLLLTKPITGRSKQLANRFKPKLCLARFLRLLKFLLRGFGLVHLLEVVVHFDLVEQVLRMLGLLEQLDKLVVDLDLVALLV